MAVIELSDGVKVEALDRVTARVRFALARASAGIKDKEAAGVAAMESVLPLMVVSVSKDGVRIETDSPFDWVLDNTESIDPLILHFSELVQKVSDPNAPGGSSTSGEKEKVSRQSKPSA
jgi:hypothetical protein